MYDCSDTLTPENTAATHGQPVSRPLPTREYQQPTGVTLNGTRPTRHTHTFISDLALCKRYPGQSWLRLRSHSAEGTHLLAQVQALAAQLHAVATPLGDGSLLLRHLSLEQTLALSVRFGGQLSVSAHIAGAALHE